MNLIKVISDEQKILVVKVWVIREGEEGNIIV